MLAPRPSLPPPPRGTALVITLFVLSLATILIVAFLTSMRLEQRSAHAFEHAQRSKLVAQGALAHAIDLLRSNIPEPSPIDQGIADLQVAQPNRDPTTQINPFEILPASQNQAPAINWMTGPGRLSIVEGDRPVTHVPLHTGEPTSADDLSSFDLNAPIPGDPFPAITYALDANGDPDPSAPPPVMRVRWVNVLADPSSPASQENPITGRYAFWIDDESTKLNFNLAQGKPAPGEDAAFFNQLNAGMQPPLFRRGLYATENIGNSSGSAVRTWALGRPQSVNFDVLFLSEPGGEDLARRYRGFPSWTGGGANHLHDHVFLQGFNRYPEAILTYLPEGMDRDSWFRRQRFNFTHYNRSPEFNAFNKPRLFTLYIPTSLEAGPLYQLPFVYAPQGGRPADAPTDIFHFNALLGRVGFQSGGFSDPELGNLPADSRITRQNLALLLRYLHRRWPGFPRSYAEQHGTEEAIQLALNLIEYGRIATSRINTGNVNAFSNELAYRSTSVNYHPGSLERGGNNPERYYWYFNLPGQDRPKPFLPTMPGPHITEIRLVVDSEPVPGDPGKFYVRFRFESEYYMHPFGAYVQLDRFPTRTDFLEITARGGGHNLTYQFGPDDPSDRRAARNWNNGDNMARLATTSSAVIGPHNNAAGHPNRVVMAMPDRYLGTPELWRIPADAETDRRRVFDASSGAQVTLGFRFRLGMSMDDGSGGGADRPRQMIPLGEFAEDTLSASADLILGGSPQVFAWEIVDPALSHDPAQWLMSSGQDYQDVGSPGRANDNAVQEPAEDSPEKSKFRLIQRAPSGANIAGAGAIDRPDEYNTRSRVSSPGYISFLRTGLHSGQPYKTLDLRPGQTPLPDWLLLDLMGATYPMAHNQLRVEWSLPDEFSAASFMQSTSGQVNLNARAYPRSTHFEGHLLDRIRPLQGVFAHLRPEQDTLAFARQIVAYQSSGIPFDYVGRLAEVPGYALGTTPFEQEALLRTMAGCLTTKSNTFGVWGVAQSVQKTRSNTAYGELEQGDSVLGQKRFYAIVERYIWPGRDGMPGNAHVSDGEWDRRADPLLGRVVTGPSNDTDVPFDLPGSPPLQGGGRSLDIRGGEDSFYPVLDGPQEVGMDTRSAHALGNIRYQPSSLEDAFNPPQPVIKYRIVYLKYLDD